MAGILRHAATLGWVLAVPDGLDPARAGIVEVRIEGGGVAIVKATAIARAIAQYEDSVWRLRQGMSHRTGAYRPIHHALGDAAARGARVTVTVLENCATDDLAARKRHWAAHRRGDA